MPTNANTFNSRVTSEALEAKFRQVFPSQSGAELPQDLFASGVLQPVIDFSSVAEGSVLPEILQTAWDFSTGSIKIATTTSTTIISNTGFWLVDLVHTGFDTVTVSTSTARIFIDDGSTEKNVWARTSCVNEATYSTAVEAKFVVFLRAGDTLKGKSQEGGSFADQLDIWYRQIADVNGTLVNPLGFTFS